MTKHEEKQKDIGGVLAFFAQLRFKEATTRAKEFVAQGPVQWVQVNQPVRKGLLLELLDVLRPGVEVAHEHEIQKWKKTR